VAARALIAVVTKQLIPTESDSSLFTAAKEALVKIGEPAVPDLLLVLNDEKADRRQRIVAGGILGEIGPRTGKKIEDVVKGLAKLLGELVEGDELDRLALVQALGQTRSRIAVEPLVAALKDPISSVRIAAARSLGEIFTPMKSEGR
jgi:HEAT repeat protein